ncbi:two-component sensor histidine kinase [Siminovitchia terrae]|uniref:histidine kinase n=1 Tax=Siminovitchia terrae TaxID=1914933 RepID=A0ABQ4L4Z6_SIMTE|nr:HAMP domain-containing sensor histidine kinase [Siminovitchia terrae]GIN98966.1 two-component sensor histidine kinase [Siminovitchia terrae]
MNILKRFILQFFKQITLAFILLSLILVTILGTIGFSTTNSEVTKDLSNADSLFFSNKISIKDEKVTFDDQLKKLVKNQDGQLLVLKENGDVIGSYNTAQHGSMDIDKNELTSLIFGNQAEYSYWSLDEEYSKPYFLLFLKKNTSLEMLNEIQSEIDLKNHRLGLSNKTLQEVDEENSWIQLIDSTGKVIDEYGTQKQPTNYSIQDLILLSQNQHDSTATYFDQETSQFLVVGTYDANSHTNLEKSFNKIINHSLLIIFILLFLLLLLSTFWYARKFGVPLIMMMKWIKNLGDGVYEQPYDHHQHPILLNRKGQLKRKYRLYKDFITTLDQLTEILKQNESERMKMIQTREEWIIGISHDLKTPLASITGYSKMLESENYSWSEEETRAFAKVISEKSSYMMELLEDLTLTYRLRNRALPIAKEEVDLNELIRRTIIHFINDPANNEMEFNFQPYHETISVSIDPKWFQRIIDNLIANAIKYNPSGTVITVSISLIEQHLIIINIDDDGIGMNEETVNKLFQRYYRGTNTCNAGNGTGLGMAISKQLVQLHNGSIQVKSIPNEGTSIRIILPIYAEDE